MILLDTNVIAALLLEIPDEFVVHWLDRQPRTSIWTTSVSVYETRLGLQVMPAGRRKSAMTALFDRILSETIRGRVVSFDHAAAQHAADLDAARNIHGRPREPRDSMIAGIVLANHAILATRNIKHFDDIARSVINPWTA
jgi:predicted nucleic acid-binding protein